VKFTSPSCDEFDAQQAVRQIHNRSNQLIWSKLRIEAKYDIFYCLVFIYDKNSAT